MSDASNIPGDSSSLRDCDLVMKGGITSGVIYPKLIAGLATRYRFRSIGGTSAGAIAAAGCAAAEFRRQTRHDAGGFTELEKLPQFVGETPPGAEGSRLRHLFQPAKAVSRHFDVLLASLNQPSKVAIVVNALGTLLWRYWAIVAGVGLALLLVVVALVRSTGPIAWIHAWWIAAVGSIAWLALGWWLAWRHWRISPDPKPLPRIIAWWAVGMAVTYWLLSVMTGSSLLENGGPRLLATFGWSLVLPLAVVCALALSAWRFVVSLLTGLHDNFWGLCSGRTSEAKPPIAGLTEWLTGYFNQLAGLGADERPLTLGDCWTGDRAAGDEPATGPEDMPAADRRVNLEVMTTAVSRHTPYAIPFRPSTGVYFFDPEEWKRLFPPTVMDWLLKASPPLKAGEVGHTEDGRALRKLPYNRDLPVVVLVRLSLSFPVLLSAIPLYAPDHTRKQNRDVPRKVWFSDGGIASNMPLHFFDEPLPRHPTFAVDLKDKHPDYEFKDTCDPDNGRVFLPRDNASGFLQHWTEPRDDARLGLFSLLWDMVETMHSWRDEMQIPMPGYRDRVVRIGQNKDEGGLNLDMPRDHIEALGRAGALAARCLIERFCAGTNDPRNDGWENHRQIRLRTFAELAELLGRHPNLHDPDWKNVIQRIKAYDAHERGCAEQVLDGITQIGPPVMDERSLDLFESAPRPLSLWRIVPRI